jgi:hypothetical protein
VSELSFTQESRLRKSSQAFLATLTVFLQAILAAVIPISGVVAQLAFKI